MTIHRTSAGYSCWLFSAWPEVLPSCFPRFPSHIPQSTWIFSKLCCLVGPVLLSCDNFGNPLSPAYHGKPSSIAGTLELSQTSSGAWHPVPTYWGESVDVPWHPPQLAGSQTFRIHFPDMSPNYKPAGRPAWADAPPCWGAVTELCKSGKWDTLTGLQCLVDAAVTTCPPAPGKAEGGAQRDAFVSISREFRCFSLRPRDPLCFFWLVHLFCFASQRSSAPFPTLELTSLLKSNLKISSASECLQKSFWDGVTRMGAHLGLRHLLFKLSESIQKLKYLNNYLH